MKNRALRGIIMIAGLSALHFPAAATTFPVAEEDVRQGEIVVNAVVFNAPCNLRIQHSSEPVLTGCGAGADYRRMNLRHVTADSPASVRIYDAQARRYSPRYPVRLANGDNMLKSQGELQEYTPSLLEVSYE